MIKHHLQVSTSERALLSPKEVHALTGISIAQLEVWRARREGPPFFKIGRMVKYERSALLSWVAQQAGAA